MRKVTPHRILPIPCPSRWDRHWNQALPQGPKVECCWAAKRCCPKINTVESLLRQILSPRVKLSTTPQNFWAGDTQGQTGQQYQAHIPEKHSKSVVQVPGKQCQEQGQFLVFKEILGTTQKQGFYNWNETRSPTLQNGIYPWWMDGEDSQDSPGTQSSQNTREWVTGTQNQGQSRSHVLLTRTHDKKKENTGNSNHCYLLSIFYVPSVIPGTWEWVAWLGAQGPAIGHCIQVQL